MRSLMELISGTRGRQQAPPGEGKVVLIGVARRIFRELSLEYRAKSIPQSRPPVAEMWSSAYWNSIRGGMWMGLGVVSGGSVIGCEWRARWDRSLVLHSFSSCFLSI